MSAAIAPALGCHVSARWVAVLLVGSALGVASTARADAPPLSPSGEEAERALARPHAATEPEEPRWILGLRALVPVYFGDVTMDGGRDYVSAEPQGGWGFRLDAAGRPVGGLTLGLAVGYTRSSMKPQLLGDTRDVLTDVFGALLVGYRGTIADVLVIGGALGLGLHVVRPPGGGWGALVELEVGLKPHPRIVLGVGMSLELIGGMSDSNSVGRVTPALIFELLL